MMYAHLGMCTSDQMYALLAHAFIYIDLTVLIVGMNLNCFT